MVLTYAKYIELISALDEYYKETKTKSELQNLIYRRYIKMHGFLIAENRVKTRKLFYSKYQREKYNKSQEKQFRNFMNNGQQG